MLRSPLQIKDIVNETKYALSGAGSSDSLMDKSMNIFCDMLSSDLQTINLFQLGFKDMCILNSFCMDFIPENALYYEDEDDDSLLLFKNEDIFNEYLLALNNVDYVILLGLLLGYPPIACSNFKQNMDNMTLHDRYLVDYQGIKFVVSRSVLKESLLWLEKNITIPIEYSTGFFLSNMSTGESYTFENSASMYSFLD